MHDLNKFLDLYGRSDFIRIMEITAPQTEGVFIRRLYEEIGVIIKTLESGRKERFDDSEDRLSVEIVNCLKSAGYISMKDPTQGGHVDILVEPKNNNKMKWYGEAKIWHGVEYLNKGINQLLSRYASGSEKNIGFLVYFKEGNMIAKMGDWFSYLIKQPDVDAGKSRVIDEKSFVTTHHHSTGTTIEVQHFSVNIHWNPI